MTGSGTPFGKTDSNIKSGIPVEKAAMQILKAMALGRTEFILGGLIY